MMPKKLRRVAWAMWLVMGCHAFAATPPAAALPPFTQPQVGAGKLAYARACGICHGANLQGGAAVALVGSTFARTLG